VARPVARLALALFVVAGCSSASPSSTPGSALDASSSRPDDADATLGAHDAAPTDVAQGGDGASVSGEAGSDGEAGISLAADRFVTGVVSFDPTECTGFGASSMPGIVEGPPVGGGTGRGSTDVVSLGSGGSIVVSFAPNAIVDGPGVDFIVFENPFWIGGNSNDVYAEPGEVSVSDDGVTWTTFPCTPTIDPQATDGTGVSPPYGECAGWHVVLSTPSNGISPVDPSVSGGDPFDLADIGVTSARYVRIVDQTHEDCPETGSRADTNGFDLDAISIVNAQIP
jgi:hypothetical protein